jgi:hypothetical protein
VRSDLPDEPFFVAQIIAVNGQRPRREVRVQWFEHTSSRYTLFGNGSWELSSILIFLII